MGSSAVQVIKFAIQMKVLLTAVKNQAKFQSPPGWAIIAETRSLLGNLYIFYLHSRAFISLISCGNDTPQLCIRLLVSTGGNVLLLEQHLMLKHLLQCLLGKGQGSR